MKKVLVIDNYDSFTYNLVHYLEALGAEVTVYRNDRIGIDIPKDFHKIVLSPGPGIPDEAGLLKEIIRLYGPEKSIFGVCLGQQAIAEVYGGSLININEVFHGVSTPVKVVAEDVIYKGLPSTFEVGRYHSWVVSPELPGELEVTAIDQNGQIMSLRHRTYDIRAVQYHPESVLTPLGKDILKNWLDHE